MEYNRSTATRLLAAVTSRIAPLWGAIARLSAGEEVVERMAELTTGYKPDPTREQQEPTY